MHRGLLASLVLVCLVCLDSLDRGTAQSSVGTNTGSFDAILQANLEIVTSDISSPPLPDNVFEADIALTEEQRRNIDLYGHVEGGRAASKNTKIRWPGGVIPYEIDCSLNNLPDAMKAVKDAIKEWQSKTCIRFVPRTNQKDYLWFFRQKGCWCNVGRIGGKTRLSVGYGCEYQHVMVHEIGHAVGFWHEQSRPDRDSYVYVMRQNILPGFETAFAKYGRDKIDSLNLAYDYESIMHYPFNAFSKNGKQTLRPLRPLNGKRPYRHLSNLDAQQTNIMYKNCQKGKRKRREADAEVAVENNVEFSRVRHKRAVCVDRHQYCGYYARQGKCRNDRWVQANCRKSCKFCSFSQAVCRDRNSYCYYTVRRRQCYTNWARVNCRKSCRLCTVRGTCVDKNRNCRSWAYRGECKRNPPYMRVNCRKSCRLCPRPPTRRPRPPTPRPRPPTPRSRPPTPRPRPPTHRPRPSTPRPRPQPDAQCGIRRYGRFPGRVVDGQNAAKNSWPWQAQLKSRFGSHFCGGSLVARQWVLTAAHCVQGKSSSAVHIRLGEHQLRRGDSTEQDFTVTRIIIHPEYQRRSANNDIALLMLNRPARLNKAVGLICLPRHGVSAPVGKNCYITGWGRTGYNRPGASVLQEAMMPIANQRKCADAMRRWGAVTSKMICGGFGGSSAVSGCFGDSGGPFVCKEKKWTLHGAVSWGTRTCSSGRNEYTVYARVSEFVNWVRRFIGASPTAPPQPPTPPPPNTPPIPQTLPSATPPRPQTPPPITPPKSQSPPPITPPKPQTPPPITPPKSQSPPPITPPKPQTPPPITPPKPQTPPPITPPPITPPPPPTRPPKPDQCTAPKPLGFENKKIPDSDLSASSSYNRWHGPREARLNLKPGVTGVGAWCARRSVRNEYLEVDLGKRTVITHVATQGRVSKYPKFVKSYYLHYSDDGNSWTRYATEFIGNIDMSTVTKNSIFPPITARYVRINPTRWKSSICMRAELFGCPVTKPTKPPRPPTPPTLPPLPPTNPPQPTTNPPRPPTNPPQPTTGRPKPPTGRPKPPTDRPKPPTDRPQPPTPPKPVTNRPVIITIPPNPTGVKCVDRNPTKCPTWVASGRCTTDSYVKKNCKKSCNSQLCDRTPVRPNAPCSNPLGIGWDNRLPDSAFRASSAVNLGTWDAGARNARLYYEDNTAAKRVGAWCPANAKDQWLQVDLGSSKYVTAVATQGRFQYFEHTKSFKLAYSLDGVSWEYAKQNGEIKFFQANCDHVTPVVNRLPRGVTARFIKFFPLKSNYPCMRVEAYGCDA